MRLSCDARNPAKPGHVFFLSALSLLTGAVTALLPAETVAARVIFAAAGLALFLLLESYALRFTAVSFRYEIREESFLVLRVIRKREKPLLSIPLRAIYAMYPVGAFPARHAKNACPTLRGKNSTGTAILYRVPESGRERAVLIECSYSFARALSREALLASEHSPGDPDPFL